MRRWIALAALVCLLLTGCGQSQEKSGLGNGWEPEGMMPLDYAHEFSVAYYPEDCKLITLSDGSRFLVVPENGQVPKGIARDIRVLHQPVENIYLAATAAMCLFDGLDRMDSLRLSGTKQEGWYIDSALQAMAQGKLLYAGKYNQPDYELILRENCQLAVESTMIGHASDVKQKLEELGIPVLVDQASHETHPLGRTEWIKLYGVLLGEEEKALELFNQQKAYLEQASQGERTGKTVAFFYISSTGNAVVRKSGDYVCKMIDLAGGEYVFQDLGDPEKATSTVNMEMEKFFATAKDADIIIYNSAISGQVEHLADLVAKNPLLEQFRAVQTGNVWCTGENMYQETTGLGEMIQSFQKVFSGEADGLDCLPYLYRLQ